MKTENYKTTKVMTKVNIKSKKLYLKMMKIKNKMDKKNVKKMIMCR